MQRTIRIADFELPRGAVSIEQLTDMPAEQWDHLRCEITRRRAADPTIPLATCRLCGTPVYIRAHMSGVERSPVFAHFPEGSPDCPWHHGPSMTPDDARAAQYLGHQESALHRRICELIGAALGRDPRCRELAIERYLRPTIADRGRYPDVYVHLEGVGRFALEIQLSKPFVPEIVGRHLHYEREGLRLVWLFYGWQEDLPQGFRDVVTMQRGNAFVVDEETLIQSHARGTLIFDCYLEGESGGFLKPKRAMLEDLSSGKFGTAFLEDRRSRRLVDYSKAGRAKWWDALKATADVDCDDRFSHAAFGPAWDSIRSFVPSLASWKDDLWRNEFVRGDRHFCEFAAILFSIAHSAVEGVDRLYLTRSKGEGALLAMLNAKIGSQAFGHYASLIETLLSRSSLSGLLDRPSLRATLAGAVSRSVQVTEADPIGSAAKRLFPEIFDGMRRAELADLAQLPRWAGGTA